MIGEGFVSSSRNSIRTVVFVDYPSWRPIVQALDITDTSPILQR
jgi:hypothetical protein